MKPLSEMTDKEFDKHLKTIEPILPIWCKEMATLSHYSSVDFTDRCGNRAVVTTAHWKDKKGNAKETVAQVKWEVK